MSYSTWSFAITVLLTNGLSCLDGKHEYDRGFLQTLDFERTPMTSQGHGMKIGSHAHTFANATARKPQIRMNLRDNTEEMGDDIHNETNNHQQFAEKVEKTRKMKVKIQLPGNMENQGTALNIHKIQIKTGGIQRTNEENVAHLLWTRMPSESPEESKAGSPKSLLPRSITNPQLNKKKSVKVQYAALQAIPNNTLPRTASKSPLESRKSFGKGLGFLRGVFGSSFGRKSSRYKSISSKTYPDSPSQPSYYWPKIPGGGEEGLPSKGNTVYTDFIKRVKSQVGGSSDHGEEVVPRKSNTGYTDYIERIKSHVAKNGNISTDQ